MYLKIENKIQNTNDRKYIIYRHDSCTTVFNY